MTPLPKASAFPRCPTRSGLWLALLLGAAVVWYARFFNALAVPNPDFFGYRAQALDYLRLSLPTHAFLRSSSLESDTPGALLDELRAKDVTYVVWDSEYDKTEGQDRYYATRHKTWLLAWLKARQPQGLEPVHHIREGQSEAIIYRFRPQQ